MPYTISIGRGPSNDIIFNHPAVSSSHAIITFAEDGTVIYTDNSTNGTTVNGKFVRGRSVYIRQGEVILLPGDVLLSWNTINSRNPYSTLRPRQEEPRREPNLQQAGQPEPQPAYRPVESGMIITDEPKRRNTCALLGLIFSIISLPFYFFIILDIIGAIFGTVGFILSFIGVFRSPRGKAIAGLVLSLIGPLIGWIVIVSAADAVIDSMYY